MCKTWLILQFVRMCRYLDPRVSNFWPQFFWWLKGSNFRPLEECLPTQQSDKVSNLERSTKGHATAIPQNAAVVFLLTEKRPSIFGSFAVGEHHLFTCRRATVSCVSNDQLHKKTTVDMDTWDGATPSEIQGEGCLDSPLASKEIGSLFVGRVTFSQSIRNI